MGCAEGLAPCLIGEFSALLAMRLGKFPNKLWYFLRKYPAACCPSAFRRWLSLPSAYPYNVILSADLAVISFKYQTSSSSINRSSNGLLILLLKVSAMWTYLSVVLMLLCPISSFTILMSVPCSSKWVANEWRSRCG